MVAIKAEPTHRRGRRARRMILEQRVLLQLQGFHVCSSLTEIAYFESDISSSCYIEFLLMKIYYVFIIWSSRNNIALFL